MKRATIVFYTTTRLYFAVVPDAIMLMPFVTVFGVIHPVMHPLTASLQRSKSITRTQKRVTGLIGFIACLFWSTTSVLAYAAGSELPEDMHGVTDHTNVDIHRSTKSAIISFFEKGAGFAHLLLVCMIPARFRHCRADSRYGRRKPKPTQHPATSFHSIASFKLHTD